MASLNAGKSWSPPDSGMAISNIQLQGVDGVDGVCFQVSMGSDNGLSNNMCSGPSTTPPAPTTKIPPANTSDFRVPPATAAGVKGTTTGGKDDTTTDGTTIDAATVGSHLQAPALAPAATAAPLARAAAATTAALPEAVHRQPPLARPPLPKAMASMMQQIVVQRPPLCSDSHLWQQWQFSPK